MLAAQLNCTDVPHARGAWSRPLTPPLFIFDLPRPAVRVSSAAPRRDMPPLLSPLHIRSLAALNALGAGLDECLSPSTLRRAYRRLARRYHPDRHPGSGAAEQQRLARAFAEATEHYRVLKSALQRA